MMICKIVIAQRFEIIWYNISSLERVNVSGFIAYFIKKFDMQRSSYTNSSLHFRKNVRSNWIQSTVGTCGCTWLNWFDFERFSSHFRNVLLCNVTLNIVWYSSLFASLYPYDFPKRSPKVLLVSAQQICA